MRQRANKISGGSGGGGTSGVSSPSAKQKAIHERSSWEISSDEHSQGSSTSAGIGTNATVPMYNPLHYHQAAAVASAVSHGLIISSPPPSTSALSSGGVGPNNSNSLAWDAVMESKRTNERLVKRAVGSGGGSVRSSTSAPGGSTTSISSSRPGTQKYIGMKGDPLLFPSVAPKFIADKDYQSYIQGRLGRSTNQSGVNTLCLARFCASFSIIAMMCLVMVGVIIDRQPLYIPGVLPQHIQYTTGDRKQQIFYAIPSGSSERLEPASNAYWSAALYFVTACICYGYANNAGWWMKRLWLQHQGKPYRDIPDIHSDDGYVDDYHDDDMRSTVPTFHNGDLPGRDHHHHRHTKKDGALPMYGDNKKLAEAWRTNNPMLASAAQRISLYISSAWSASQDRRRNKRRFAGAKDV